MAQGVLLVEVSLSSGATATATNARGATSPCPWLMQRGLSVLAVSASRRTLARHYDPHFFKALLSTLNPSKIEGDPRCALLCPALMDLRVKLPDMDPVGLERYAGYARGVFRRQQLAAAAPEEERRHIAEAVAAAGMECQELADVDGYIVDVLVTAPESNEGAKPVALLYHSPRRTLHLRTNEPLGQAMMRHRHLRNQGFGVVNVWDRSWDSLELDDRVDFLRARVAGTLKQGSREQSSHL
mmetsp:Transcript_78413/g.217771  ORF Transcript_78413/g.217771 Transcript_78413/m.217771 type:complete len:241 (+) Transcript_78413:118-840(+)